MNPSMDIELGNIIATTQYNSRAPKNLSGVTQYYCQSPHSRKQNQNKFVRPVRAFRVNPDANALFFFTGW